MSTGFHVVVIQNADALERALDRVFPVVDCNVESIEDPEADLESYFVDDDQDSALTMDEIIAKHENAFWDELAELEQSLRDAETDAAFD